MFQELCYSGVGFSLLLLSATRGPLRGPSLSTRTHLPAALWHLKEELSRKLKRECDRRLKTKCFCGPFLFEKRHFFCRRLWHAGGASAVLTENLRAATSAEENPSPVEERGSWKNTKTTANCILCSFEFCGIRNTDRCANIFIWSAGDFYSFWKWFWSLFQNAADISFGVVFFLIPNIPYCFMEIQSLPNSTLLALHK